MFGYVVSKNYFSKTCLKTRIFFNNKKKFSLKKKQISNIKRHFYVIIDSHIQWYEL